MLSVIDNLKLLTEVRIFKWIPKNLKKGALHKELGIDKDKKIPKELLLKIKKRLQEKAAKTKLSKKELRTLRRVNLALVFRDMK